MEALCERLDRLEARQGRNYKDMMLAFAVVRDKIGVISDRMRGIRKQQRQCNKTFREGLLEHDRQFLQLTQRVAALEAKAGG